ncbi:VOC family protein [Brevundimonas sp. AJA228-03]|uniref:VOC family protein n=1 Tax=Brevundimonas sp. AJA228-03 TaxID=2752515 RepID=UPI001AE08CEB|nr:VOC family protein [Brevundimonas sp. AJA228-03]QTN20730.1 VOC family protein [Brevundimonas sp. AJA228-03]
MEQVEAPRPLTGITPYLSIASRGADAAAEFYRAALGAVEVRRMVADDGERLLHVHLHINGGSVMLSDEFPEYGGEVDVEPKSVTLHLYVDDVDEWWNRAITAGAVPVHPLADQFWGDRYGVLKDPFGHSWSIGSPIRNT